MEGTTAITWGKIVLLFQAVATLLIGIVFFLQITGLDERGIQEFKINANSGLEEGNSSETEQQFINVTNRFKIAGYVLLVVSLVEILIISRFID
tara:strand:- start:10294 stop:10575 length:282 start_codon:yes stop_codon:yes gene_type:complete